MTEPIAWDLPDPHVTSMVVATDDIDRMGHANNAAYVRWLEHAAWDHTQAVGLSWNIYQQLNRSFVALRTEIDYLRPALEGDALLLATWVVENDCRLSMTRRYQILRESDQVTLIRARTRWVCVAIDSGKPKRMPEAFAKAYPLISES